MKFPTFWFIVLIIIGALYTPWALIYGILDIVEGHPGYAFGRLLFVGLIWFGVWWLGKRKG